MHITSGSLRLAALAIVMGFASSAFSRELRDFCPDRPGRGTPPCIVDAGHVMGEMSLVDFTREDADGVQTDTLLFGDFLIRAGVTSGTEVRIGWTPVGTVRMRDLVSHAISRRSGVGDVSIGFRTSLKNPDGSGVSLAVQPSVTLPTGSDAIGAGTWGAALVIPSSFALTKHVQLALAPEVDAAPDSDGGGRHVRYGAVVGVGIAVTPALDAGANLVAFRDEDPAGHTTESAAEVTLAWTPAAMKDVQFDADVSAGLNSDTPALQFIAGIAKRF